MSFNRIKSILGDGPESDLVKALSRSAVLEVSEDGTKVKRKTELRMKSQEEIDDCTIYVEQIPINSTIQSLQAILSRYGKINYISLPRYKKSRQIKQFGFIEFDEPETVQKVLSAFKKFDAVLQYSCCKPENLLSIASFNKEETEAAKAATTDQPPKKEEEEDDEPPAKKVKIEEETKVEEPKAEVKAEPKVEPKAEKQESESGSSEDEQEEADGTKDVTATATAKKKRSRKKKSSSSKAFTDERIMAMKVMRKKDWKKMRNIYLNMERQKAKEIKKVLRDSYNKRHNNAKTPSQKEKIMASPHINFYGSPNDRAAEPMDHSSEMPSEAQSSTSGIAFTPGVIVNIKFREPCEDNAELKKEMKQFAYVQYVDIAEGGGQCYIRVDATNSAAELASQYSSCEYETEVLKGDAEKEYWKKIFEKRDKKKAGKTPEVAQKSPAAKKRRGRERLIEKISKAAQHIRFDEEEAVE